MSIEDNPMDYLVKVKDKRGQDFFCLKDSRRDFSKVQVTEDLSSCVPASFVSSKRSD